MDISPTGARPATQITPITPVAAIGADTTVHGEAVPAEDRALHVRQGDIRAGQEEQRQPTTQQVALQAASDLARLVLSQADAVRQTDDARDAESGDDLQTRAVRAYEESAQVLDEARALIDRVVLLPEPGDLSLEASQMPPYGPPMPGV